MDYKSDDSVAMFPNTDAAQDALKERVDRKAAHFKELLLERYGESRVIDQRELDSDKLYESGREDWRQDLGNLSSLEEDVPISN